MAEGLDAAQFGFPQGAGEFRLEQGIGAGGVAAKVVQEGCVQPALAPETNAAAEISVAQGYRSG